MIVSCADLDPFFDGELSPEARAAFLDHLTTCERCQAALFGRAQEEEIVGGARAGGSRSPAIAALLARRFKRVMCLAPILAAAAVIAIWLGISKMRRARPIELSLTVEHMNTAIQRGNPPRDHAGAAPAAGSMPRVMARVGDVLRPTVRGAVVYRDNQELMVACPADAGCSGGEGEITLDLHLASAGEYSIIAIGSAELVRAPHASVDVMLNAVVSAGALFERWFVVVR